MSFKLTYHNAEILQDICTRLSRVTPNVYSEFRPDSEDKQVKELIVVDYATRIYNHNPYQDAYVRIELYLRKKGKGIADTKRMDSLANAVAALFPMSTERYSLIEPVLGLKGSDPTGNYSVWMFTAKLYVNTLDNYHNTITTN